MRKILLLFIQFALSFLKKIGVPTEKERPIHKQALDELYRFADVYVHHVKGKESASHATRCDNLELTRKVASLLTELDNSWYTHKPSRASKIAKVTFTILRSTDELPYQEETIFDDIFSDYLIPLTTLRTSFEESIEVTNQISFTLEIHAFKILEMLSVDLQERRTMQDRMIQIDMEAAEKSIEERVKQELKFIQSRKQNKSEADNYEG